MPHDLLRPPTGRRASASSTDRGYDDDADSIEWARRLSERQLAPYRAAADAPTTATTAAPTTAQTYAHKASDNATQDALLASIGDLASAMRIAGGIIHKNAGNVRPDVEVADSLAQTAVANYKWIGSSIDAIVSLAATANKDPSRRATLLAELATVEQAFADLAAACGTGVAHGLPTKSDDLAKKLDGVYAAFGVPRKTVAAGTPPPDPGKHEFDVASSDRGTALARAIAAAVAAARSLRSGTRADLDRLTAHLRDVVRFADMLTSKELRTYIEPSALAEALAAFHGRGDKMLEGGVRSVVDRMSKP